MPTIPWLSELHEKAWTEFEVAYGDAGRLPEHIVALTTDDAEVRHKALLEIRNAIMAEDLKFEAALHVTPFLLSLLRDDLAIDRLAILQLLRQLAFRDEHEYIFGYFIPEARHNDSDHLGDEDGTSIGVYHKVMDGVPVYLESLRTGDVQERLQAAALLSYFPLQRATTVPHLLDHMHEDADPAVVATLEIALGLLGQGATPEVRPALYERLHHTNTLIRWGAAIAVSWDGVPGAPGIIDTLEECASADRTPIPFMNGTTGLLASWLMRRESGAEPPY
ncbi:HEAT repeat-containing protein [Nonomuraea solani]|uniref:HEAT repeat-containing protein n=1 Tax=Nonomuraea solani TaxID=1144553 RepID=A0A1H5YAE3_9ACTN|nr:HEAT repeat domain-containing protein [Nonomuraea solani]SEG21011.1 HEAT repeat-containing protein [Nonomuraea solani]